MKRSIFTIVAVMLVTMLSYGQTKLSGTVVGTPDNLTGVGETVSTLFDGDFATGFDTGSEAKNEAWAGLDFGEGVYKKISSLRFALRIPGNLANIGLMKERLAGAKIYGANTVTIEDPTSNAVKADITDNLLYEIPLSIFDNVTVEEYVSVDISLNTDKSYRYILIFFDEASFGNCSEFEVYGTDGTTTDVEDLAVQSIAVYPNPSIGLFNVDVDNKAVYTVYNLSGVIVKKGTTTGAFELDLSNSAKGVYILEVETENGVVIERIVFQ